MPERHSVDFERVSFNIISDAGRATITLQFSNSGGGGTSRDLLALKLILKAIEGRYGGGIKGRLSRWNSGARSPFVLPSTSKPHPEAPDVLCFEMSLKPGERMDSVLAEFLEFLSQQPGYRRTFGSPIDLDRTPSRAQQIPSTDISQKAGDMLTQFFKRRGNDSSRGRS